jgi:hypothetical protein
MSRHEVADVDDGGWESDQVMTRGGVAVPVRATARRPTWGDLPDGVQDLIERRLGRSVVSAWSAGTGFTPGFASRLNLDDGAAVFVKAASTSYDREHGWPLSDAYRSEVRKLGLLPPGVGAPPLLWHEDVEVEGERWIVVAFEYVDARPPRRPWRPEQLALVLAKLDEVAGRLTPVPLGLELETVQEELIGNLDERLESIRSVEHDAAWLGTVTDLCRAADDLIGGDTVVHMDLREDNVLIDSAGGVWFVDWNWPVAGAPWIDLVCLVLSAVGDGHDGDMLLADHPLTRDVDPVAVDSLLAVIWTFWAVAVDEPGPHGSPHLRDHQRWYLDVTREWLSRRLAAR